MKSDIIKKLYLPQTINRLKRKVHLLGLDSNYDIYNFLNKRLLASICIFLVGLVIFPFSYITSPVMTVLYYYLVEYICFDIPLKQRAKTIAKEALYFFEAVLLALESGNSLKEALEEACESVAGELAYDLKGSLQALELGKDLNTCLKDFQNRIPNEMVQNIIINIINTNKFGNNITNSVKMELEYIKKQEHYEKQKKMHKLPIYVKLVSFLFISIILVLIIVLPMFLNMVK